MGEPEPAVTPGAETLALVGEVALTVATGGTAALEVAPAVAVDAGVALLEDDEESGDMSCPIQPTSEDTAVEMKLAVLEFCDTTTATMARPISVASTLSTLFIADLSRPSPSEAAFRALVGSEWRS